MSEDSEIRCSCNDNRDYGSLMIQCDKCDCWVHAFCYAIRSDAIPEYFVCRECADYRIVKVLLPNQSIHRFVLHRNQPIYLGMNGLARHFQLALNEQAWFYRGQRLDPAKTADQEGLQNGNVISVVY